MKLGLADASGRKKPEIEENSEYNITEVIQNLNIILENDKKIESMIIGFVRVE